MLSRTRKLAISASLAFFSAAALFSVTSLVAQDSSTAKKTISAAHGPSGASKMDPQIKAAILSKLKSARPDLNFTSVAPSAMPGLYEVEFNGGGIVYTTETAGHFVVGEVYQVNANGIVNLTEARKNVDRAAAVKALKPSDLIVYSPKGEIKASMYVFTDVDCGYCRLIHKEVPALNDMGVEVRYLAFPRAGLGSKSYQKIASAWCADNKQSALDDLKAGKDIKIDVCKDNPVGTQYALAQKLGVSGTPAIVFESGELVPGYIKADEIARRLKL